jgi:hypothetical protein
MPDLDIGDPEPLYQFAADVRLDLAVNQLTIALGRLGTDAARPGPLFQPTVQELPNREFCWLDIGAALHC